MKQELGIYIHWPFCVSKCPYCDFNSHIRRSVEECSWCDAILNELSFYRDYTKNHYIKSIFFGGGTPSLMAPSTVEKIIIFIKENWLCDEVIEITLEANPNSVEVEKFLSLKQAGVNRISMGIQSLNSADLKFLGRSHSVDEAINAIETARKTFSNFSFDLIYALPTQTLGQWEEELKQALRFQTKHLSLYQLTIEQGTPFYKQYNRGDWQIPSHEKAADFYNLTQTIMEKNDLPAYEVSNHAVHNYECQHNLIYWRYKDFLGVGPGAHGRIKYNNQIIATQNYKAPKKWLENVLISDKKGCEQWSVLTEPERFEEKLLMNLRLSEPCIISSNEQRYINKNQLSILHQGKFLLFNEGNFSIQILSSGRLVLNKVIESILRG
jgi:putative oxygen-independent coproporphyrinogen III oxidase